MRRDRQLSGGVWGLDVTVFLVQQRTRKDPSGLEPLRVGTLLSVRVPIAFGDLDRDQRSTTARGIGRVSPSDLCECPPSPAGADGFFRHPRLWWATFGGSVVPSSRSAFGGASVCPSVEIVDRREASSRYPYRIVPTLRVFSLVCVSSLDREGPPRR